MGSKFMLAFETLKQAFEGVHSDEQDEDLEVPLKMEKLDMDNEDVCRHYDESEGTIKFTPKEMEDFYAPVLKSAFKLVKDQVAKTERARMPKVEVGRRARVVDLANDSDRRWFLLAASQRMRGCDTALKSS